MDNTESLLALVSKLSQNYNNGLTASVSYDTANKIMNGILYCLDQTDHDITNEISTGFESLDDRYKKGQEIVKTKYDTALNQYKQIMNDFIHFNSYGVYTLEAEMTEAFRDFFKKYDYQYLPAEDPVTFSYVVMGDIKSMHGIDSALMRLNHISIEQKFLKIFPDNWIKNVIQDFTGAPINSVGYQHMIGSIAYEVLRRIVLCYISIQPFDTNRLKLIEKLSDIIYDIDIDDEVDEAMNIISEKYCNDDISIKEYISLGRDTIIHNLKKARDTNFEGRII